MMIRVLSEKLQVTQMCVTYVFLKMMLIMIITLMVMMLLDDHWDDG